MQVSQADIMVCALVLLHFRLKVFNYLLLLIYRCSVSLSILQEAFILLDELFHSNVEEILSKVLGSLHHVSTSFQVCFTLSQHFSCRGKRPEITLENNLAIFS